MPDFNKAYLKINQQKVIVIIDTRNFYYKEKFF